MSEFIAVGFAAFYLWYLLSQATIFDKVLSWPREHWGPLVNCSFCAGFWITGLMLLAVDGFSGYNLTTHLAAAGLVGVLGVVTA